MSLFVCLPGRVISTETVHCCWDVVVSSWRFPRFLIQPSLYPQDISKKLPNVMIDIPYPKHLSIYCRVGLCTFFRSYCSSTIFLSTKFQHQIGPPVPPEAVAVLSRHPAVPAVRRWCFNVPRGDGCPEDVFGSHSFSYFLGQIPR